jgi:anti-anti-sigma factor
MCVAAFHVSVSNQVPDVVSVRCRGELDIATIGRFQEAIETAVAERPDRLVLDVSGASFTSIDALGYLVELTLHCRRLRIGVDLDLTPSAWRVVDYLRPDEALRLQSCRFSCHVHRRVPRLCHNPLEAARGRGPLFARASAPSPTRH